MKDSEQLRTVPDTVLRNIVATRRTIQELKRQLPKKDSACDTIKPTETGLRLLHHDFVQWHRRVTEEFGIDPTISNAEILAEQRTRILTLRELFAASNNSEVVKAQKQNARIKYNQLTAERDLAEGQFELLAEEFEDGNTARSQIAAINESLRQRKLARIRQRVLAQENL